MKYILAFKRTQKGESGQAMVEFAVVFPVLFLLFLTILQTAMLLTARQMVNYAAFCSARSAIVWIPEDAGVAPAKIKRAAVIACIPISPRKGGSSSVLDFLKDLMKDLPGFPAIDDMIGIGERFSASEALTEVITTVGSEDVTVEVTHNACLSIPVVNRIFYEACDGTEIIGLFTIPVKASCTLTLEKEVSHGKCCS